MNCIIIDDDKVSTLLIENYCETFQIEVKASFHDPVQGLKWLISNEVDVVFLDIHMPMLSGIDIIKSLVKPPKIVLMSSDPNFAVEAFEFPYVIDYLLKPVARERFDKMLQKIKTTPNTATQTSKEKETPVDSNKHIFININKRLIKIALKSIDFIKADRDYIEIFTPEEVFKVHTTLTSIEKKLPTDTFFKIHRSYIINLNKIIDIELNSVLIDKHVIPISRRKKPALMEKLNLL